MKPMNTKLFQKYYDRLDRPEQMLDLDNISYDEWEGEYGEMFYGFRHKTDQTKHGIVRMVNKTDPIYKIGEATYANDELIGLDRRIVKLQAGDRVKTAVNLYIVPDVEYKAVNLASRFTFNSDFAESGRIYVGDDMLADLTAMYFRK